jgi:small subunit ribosomal protein S17
MKGRKKVKQGIVVSDKMNKSIVVRVDERRAHSRYGKKIRISNKFHAHDEKNEAKIGDEVVIMETRPLSKTKNWRLFEIKKRNAANVGPGEEINEANLAEKVK